MIYTSHYFYLFFICLIFFLKPSFQKEDRDGDNDEFIPTREWQRVKEDQAIPPGLHVKMDLSSGGKWAKLMDKEDDDINALTLMPSKDENEPQSLESVNEKTTSYKLDELKDALKKFKAEKIENESAEMVKSKYRSINEIREAFKEFDVHEETDVQVMKRLVSIIENKNSNRNASLLALQDLEYYVHQIDNANDLITFGGFAVVVQTLNSSDPVLVEEAAHVIGSAMQSNPKVQIEALRSGVLRTLLLFLSSPNQLLAVRKKSLYAISALVRHFPLAQVHLAQYGGFQVLLDLFSQRDTEMLQIKAIRLIYDLMDERLSTEKDVRNKQQAEKLKQYHRVNLPDIIEELGWCPVISASLRYDQHSWRESVMKAMKILNEACHSQFKNNAVIRVLSKNQLLYKHLWDKDRAEGELDSYYASMYQLTEELLAMFTKERLRRTEL